MARIAVIGAGAGHEVVLWEARDRVGGRAHTDATFASCIASLPRTGSYDGSSVNRRIVGSKGRTR